MQAFHSILFLGRKCLRGINAASLSESFSISTQSRLGEEGEDGKIVGEEGEDGIESVGKEGEE